ncbi:MAG: hypothetical protein SGARI_002314 [Bacillariaceae sp.]
MTSLLDLPVLCLARIASFNSSSEDLCSLDLTSRVFGPLTKQFWMKIAKEEFGVKNEDGKLAWRKGNALTSPERNRLVVFKLQEGDVPVGCSAASSRSIVGIPTWLRKHEGTIPILIRDAQTMEQVSVITHPITHPRDGRPYDCIALGGEGDYEAMGLCREETAGFTVTQAGGYVHQIPLQQHFPEDTERLNSVDDKITCVLGSTNHFICFCVGKLYVFKFDGTKELSEKNSLVAVQQSMEIFTMKELNKYTTEDGSDYFAEFCMKWGGSEVPSVLHLNSSTSKLSLVQRLQTEPPAVLPEPMNEYQGYADVAISEKYIVTYTLGEQEHIEVFDRHGERRFQMKAEFDKLDSPGMNFVGEILVCCSNSSRKIQTFQMNSKVLRFYGPGTRG